MFENEEKDRIEILKEKWGDAMKYLDKDCPHCGRHRVEFFKNGKEVCEKCSYNAVTNEFEDEHFELHN